MTDSPFIINIGRQLGSGGRAIGRLLAERLDIAYYDKEILAMAAKESGFCTEIFERRDEQKGIFRSLFGSLTPLMGGSGNFYRNEISDENLFRIQSEAIRKAAGAHSCIFIGRVADYVLREHPRCVNVFIAADTDDRVQRICEFEQCDRAAALKLIEHIDRQRADFYNFYSARQWGAAATYDLCINSSALGIEGTADFILDFVHKKLNIARPE